MEYIINNLGQYLNTISNQYVVITSTSAVVDPPAFLTSDGSTWGWYKGDEEATFTKDGAGLVTTWADYLAGGNDLTYYAEGTYDSTPLWEAPGTVTFTADASTELRCYNTNLIQPFAVYMVVDRKDWVSSKRIFAGWNSNCRIYSYPSTPDLQIYAGSFSVAPSTDLADNTWGVVVGIFDSTNSLIQVNNNAPNTGDAGTDTGSGVSFGLAGSHTNYSNAAYKEIIIRQSHDPTIELNEIVTYLMSKHSIT